MKHSCLHQLDTGLWQSGDAILGSEEGRPAPVRPDGAAIRGVIRAESVNAVVTWERNEACLSDDAGSRR